MINLRPLNSRGFEGQFEVFWDTKYLGDFVAGDDGYYGFFPRPIGGMFTPDLLKSLVESLDKLNAEWDVIVKNEIASGIRDEM